MQHDHSECQHAGHRTRSGKVFTWLICGLAVIAAYFVITAHWAHVSPLLPYAVLMVCPLMHLFMHRHHGRGSHHHDSMPRKDVKPSGSERDESRR